MEQQKYKHHSRDTERIINSIRERNGEWVPVNLKMIQEVTGVNTAYASFVFQSVKQSKELESKIVYPPNSQRKNLEFRLKIVQPTDEATSKKHKKYSNITEQQAKIIQDSLAAQKVAGQSLDTLFQVANVIASHGGTENYVENFVTKVGDLLIMRVAQVRLYIDILVKVNVLHVDGNKAMLTFGEPVRVSPEQASKVQEELSSGVSQVASAQADNAATAPEIKTEDEFKQQPLFKRNPALEQKDKPTEQEKPKAAAPVAAPAKPKEPAAELKPVAEEKYSQVEATSESVPGNHLQQEMIDGISGFGRILGEFQIHVDDLAKKLMAGGGVDQQMHEQLKAELEVANEANRSFVETNSRLTQEIEELRTQIERKESLLANGNKVLDELMSENTATKEALKKKSDEEKKQRMLYVCQKEINENVFATMQERLQIAIADINTTVVDFTRIPAWQIKPADTARVQTEILKAITTAIEDIVKANNTESKYAKDA